MASEVRLCGGAWRSLATEVPHMVELLLPFIFSPQRDQSERCVSVLLQFFLCPPPPPNSDSTNNVTLFHDGLGSEFKDLQQAPYQALPDGLFIPHFLTHRFWSLYFLLSPCRAHGSSRLSGAIKKIWVQLPHSCRKCRL